MNNQAKTTEEELKMPQPALNPKYIELINKDKGQIEQEQLELYAEESQANIDGDILATKKEILQVKRELEKKKSEKPITPKSVIETQQKLKALQGGLQALEDLKAELF